MTEAADQTRISNPARNSGMGSQSASPGPDSPSLPPKLGQSNYRRVSCTEESSSHPIPGLPADVLHMRVKEGSKIRNLLRFAVARMQGEGAVAQGPPPRQVVFTGSDRGVTKTITCVEILKRKVGGLHQVSKLHYKTLREVWESSQRGVPSVAMKRSVAAICILLSKDPLDPLEPGYQPPQTANTPTEDAGGSRAPLGPLHSPSSHSPAKRRRVDHWKKCASSTSSQTHKKETTASTGTLLQPDTCAC